jgi:hypothetical protein
LAFVFGMFFFTAANSSSVRIYWRVMPVAVFLPEEGGYTETFELTVNAPILTPLDLERGYVEVFQPVLLQVASNTEWMVYAVPLRPDLDTSIDESSTLSSGKLWVKIDGEFTLVETNAPLGTLLAEGGRGLFALSIHFRIGVPENGLPEDEYKALLFISIKD